MLAVTLNALNDDLIIAKLEHSAFQMRHFNRNYDSTWLKLDIEIDGFIMRVNAGQIDREFYIQINDEIYSVESRRNNVVNILLNRSRVGVYGRKCSRRIFNKFMIMRRVFLRDILMNIVKLFTDPRLYFDLNKFITIFSV